MRCSSRGKRLFSGRRGADPYPGFVRFAVAVTLGGLETTATEEAAKIARRGFPAAVAVTAIRHLERSEAESKFAQVKPQAERSKPTEPKAKGEIYEGSPIPHRG